MNPRQLKARFPYMFTGEGLDFAFYRGWFALFATLCEDIDTLLGDDKHGFHWVQLKEKFGSARFYWQMEDATPELHVDVVSAGHVATLVIHDTDAPGPDQAGTPVQTLRQRISDLVREATHATHTLCIVCGQPGALNEDKPWLLVLCEQHAEQRRRGRLAPAWFDEQER